MTSSVCSIVVISGKRGASESSAEKEDIHSDIYNAALLSYTDDRSPTRWNLWSTTSDKD